MLDGAPSPKIGKKRKGQTNADLLLCQRNKPLIPVEVETTTDNCEKKLQSLFSYFNETEYTGIQFGLLVITNLRNNDWENYREKIERMIIEQQKDIAIILIFKQKAQLGDDLLSNLRKRNMYYSWDIKTINYRIYKNRQEKNGTI